jgi:predicted PurR-regulated permease PerM
MARGTVENVAFYIVVGVTTLAFAAMLQTFLMPVFWAAVLATVFDPMQQRNTAALRGRRTLAAVATLLTIVALVILPLGLLGLAMSREILQLNDQVREGRIDLRAPLRWLQEIVPLADQGLARVGISVDDLGQRLSSGAVAITQFLASRALALGQDVLRFAAFFFLCLYVLFFFLRDGRELVGILVRVVPLGDTRERRLLAKFGEVAFATLKGTVVVGVVQGALGGVLFWILGIPGPVFWGSVMTGLSILPAVGPGLVWGPAAIILFALGEPVRAIVMIAAGVLVIGLVDNLLRPILVGRDTQMPDYLVLLSTLGGLAMFGISGFVIGPLIAAFFLAVWEMFAEEHAERGTGAADPPVPPPPLGG